MAGESRLQDGTDRLLGFDVGAGDRTVIGLSDNLELAALVVPDDFGRGVRRFFRGVKMGRDIHVWVSRPAANDSNSTRPRDGRLDMPGKRPLECR
jgi:hypothetical protein